MTDGMFNYTSGKWNPSRDDHRYDQSNSFTSFDAVAIGGSSQFIRKIGNTKPPFLLRVGGGAVESSYRGARTLNEWRKLALKSRALKRSPFPIRDMKKKYKVLEVAKAVARASLTKKGMVTTGTLITSLVSVTNTPSESSQDNQFGRSARDDDTFLFNRKKAQGGNYFGQSN